MSKKILVVDDESDLAALVKVRLEKEGYQIELAYDGQEALEKTATFQPSLIVLDLRLPKVDGYDVCRYIRTDEKTKNIPIIMLTARDSKIEEEIGREMGASAYLRKPYDPEVLLSKVRELLK